MSKSILSRTLMSVSILLSASLVAQEVTITWDASLQPGQIESFIQGDTTATGEQANTVYILEKGFFVVVQDYVGDHDRPYSILVVIQRYSGMSTRPTRWPWNWSSVW